MSELSNGGFLSQAIDLSTWLASNSSYSLADHFGKPRTLFEKFPRKQIGIAPPEK